MVKRRLTATVLLALGSLAGAALWRRRGGGRQEHVDLYFADGSMVSFEQASREAASLLPVARRVLEQTR